MRRFQTLLLICVLVAVGLAIWRVETIPGTLSDTVREVVKELVVEISADGISLTYKSGGYPITVSVVRRDGESDEDLVRRFKGLLEATQEEFPRG